MGCPLSKWCTLSLPHNNRIKTSWHVARNTILAWKRNWTNSFDRHRLRCKKQNVSIWNGFVWLRTRSTGGLLWIWQWRLYVRNRQKFLWSLEWSTFRGRRHQISYQQLKLFRDYVFWSRCIHLHNPSRILSSSESDSIENGTIVPSTISGVSPLHIFTTRKTSFHVFVTSA